MIDKRILVLFIISIACLSFLFSLDPVPQNPAYHLLADTRIFFSIPNTWDVLSNIPFLIVGLTGMKLVSHTELKQHIQYFIFFVGVALTALGSAYYHLAPDNNTLVWDRLPMTIAFMAFLSSVIYECISQQAGKKLLLPLLIIGISSVAYWAWTEQVGQGDLRFYAMVQFLPMILIPFILALYKPKKEYAVYIMALIVFYAFSKVFEYFDNDIFELTGFVSGHTLKHLSAATGTAMILSMFSQRNTPGRKIPPPEAP